MAGWRPSPRPPGGGGLPLSCEGLLIIPIRDAFKLKGTCYIRKTSPRLTGTPRRADRHPPPQHMLRSQRGWGDPKTRRVRGQAVGGRVRAVDARTETILPIGTPTPKTRRNGHGRYHPLVPTFYPPPHLRPHLRPEAQPAGRSWSQGLTCQRCSWAGRMGAGPLYKRPTVSLAGQLSPGDFGKKWGTPSSHLACQEPAWPTEGSWTLRGPDQLHTQHNWGD